MMLDLGSLELAFIDMVTVRGSSSLRSGDKKSLDS